nr:undecaprenyl-diphosphate phosphatase [Nakamurella aerolata]
MITDMPWWHAVLFGALEGLTEFLPVSSTGHLTILEKLLGYPIDAPEITAFTAIIQAGAVLATLIYLWKDIVRVVTAWWRGLLHRDDRGADYKFGWAVILGCIPIGIVGFLFQDQIETTLRSLWIVGGTLIGFSAVMWFADRYGKQDRTEREATWKDTLVIGLAQCLALIPGVSRSGATMSAGLLRGLNRVAVTRLSFFLSIPALTAAAVLQTVTRYDEISTGIGWGPTLLATAVSFVVAYLAVNWLLKFVARHTYSVFIVWRVVVGTVLLLLLATKVISAT